MQRLVEVLACSMQSAYAQFERQKRELSGNTDNDPIITYGLPLVERLKFTLARICSVLALLRYEEPHGNKIRSGVSIPELADGTKLRRDKPCL